MADCLFCQIVEKKVPARVVLEDERAVAFEDIHPQAPVHVLVIPRRHIATTADLTTADRELVGDLVLMADRIARARLGEGRGYRLVMNCGAEAGQLVFHMHLHLLGGRPMKWPPG
ncbi:MAG: histidine triad nucleotide-binding protein [bacterium]